MPQDLEKQIDHIAKIKEMEAANRPAPAPEKSNTAENVGWAALGILALIFTGPIGALIVAGGMIAKKTIERHVGNNQSTPRDPLLERLKAQVMRGEGEGAEVEGQAQGEDVKRNKGMEKNAKDAKGAAAAILEEARINGVHTVGGGKSNVKDELEAVERGLIGAMPRVQRGKPPVDVSAGQVFKEFLERMSPEGRDEFFVGMQRAIKEAAASNPGVRMTPEQIGEVCQGYAAKALTDQNVFVDGIDKNGAKIKVQLDGIYPCGVGSVLQWRQKELADRQAAARVDEAARVDAVRAENAELKRLRAERDAAALPPPQHGAPVPAHVQPQQQQQFPQQQLAYGPLGGDPQPRVRVYDPERREIDGAHARQHEPARAVDAVRRQPDGGGRLGHHEALGAALNDVGRAEVVPSRRDHSAVVS